MIDEFTCNKIETVEKGWAFNAVYQVKYGNKLWTGRGTGTSTISEQDAKDKAKAAAVANAHAQMYSGTPPIGVQQLFNPQHKW